MTKIVLDLKKEKTEPFNHYWKRSVGSCHAHIGLRADWQQQLKQVHTELGFQYIRFHGLLDDDMGIYQENRNGEVDCNFNRVDKLFDYILEIGMKPFVEFGFMPKKLATGEKTVFWFKSNVTPPKDYGKWAALIEQLVRHWKDRYGLKEIRSWFYEVWNEPDHPAFFSGTKEDYFKLYQYTVKAVKTVDLELRVGGPAGAANIYLADFVEFCAAFNIPVDFLSLHCYCCDLKYVDETVKTWTTLPAQHAYEYIQKNIVLEKASKIPNLKFHYTEWNITPSSRDQVHDTLLNGAFNLEIIKMVYGLVESFSFWTFSDIFEEAGVPQSEFHGGFGLLTESGIKKPTYHSFWLLNQLGNKRFETRSAPLLMTKKPDGSLQVLGWNYKSANESSDSLQITVEFLNLKKKRYKLTRYLVNEKKSNALFFHQQMGAPRFPDWKQRSTLKEKSEIYSTIQKTKSLSSLSFNFHLAPNTIEMITIEQAV